LAGGIPDLQLDPLSIEFNRPDFEVDSDRGDEGRCEGILAESQQATRFADAGVAYEEEFDLVGVQVRKVTHHKDPAARRCLLHILPGNHSSDYSTFWEVGGRAVCGEAEDRRGGRRCRKRPRDAPKDEENRGKEIPIEK
jgi:hypothetical protein